MNSIEFEERRFFAGFFEDDLGFIDDLVCLYKTLKKNVYSQTNGPYPVSHGIMHIERVLVNVGELLFPYIGVRRLIDERGIYFLMAAALYHDAGMIYMIDKGAYGQHSKNARNEHPSIKRICESVRGSLRECGKNEWQEEIPLLIAWAHAADSEWSVEQKIQETIELSTRLNYQPIILLASILRLADYLDIGQGRLNPIYKRISWGQEQIEHIRKHEILDITIHKERNAIEISNKLLTEASQLACFALLRIAHDDLLKMTEHLNSLAPVSWRVYGLKESEFGKIYPLSCVGMLFARVFRDACDNRKDRMSVDMMGHSLYGRFVEDKEGINERLLDLLENGNLVLRVLLLDPQIENQQAREVLEAQFLFEDRSRRVLPDYDVDGNAIESSGDIHLTLNELKSKWASRVGEGSVLEVRLTTRLMYASMAKFDSNSMVTSYSNGGLFDHSFTLSLGKNSPLKGKYQNEFDSIWNNRMDTRLWLLKGVPRKSNPLEGIVNQSNISGGVFDYERTLLGKHLERVLCIFDSVLKGLEGKKCHARSPLEIEFQPSEECTLNCTHCIGRFFKKWRMDTPLEHDRIKLDSILEFEDSGLRVDRMRISGLLGDPLHGRSEAFTYELIRRGAAAGKDVVLFTNGSNCENLIKEDILRCLKNIHISLDAASKSTFNRLKNPGDLDLFDRICNSIRSLRYSGDSLQFGLGFVITRDNVHEIDDFIKLGNRLGANFIRFKPDIRPLNRVRSRQWMDIQETITEKQTENGDINLVITKLPLQHYGCPATEYCWAQHLFVAIRGDGKLFPCDHLTLNSDEYSLGDLTIDDFGSIWTSEHTRRRLGRIYDTCEVCPPFNWRINRFLDQLFVIYKEHGSKVRGWAEDIVRCHI